MIIDGRMSGIGWAIAFSTLCEPFPICVGLGKQTAIAQQEQHILHSHTHAIGYDEA